MVLYGRSRLVLKQLIIFFRENLGIFIFNIRVWPSHLPLEVFIVFELKKIKNSNGQMRQQYAYAANKNALNFHGNCYLAST